VTKRSTRHSEIRVTGADGVTHTGTGQNLAQAARDLGRQRPEDDDPDAWDVYLDATDAAEALDQATHQAVSRWTLTSAGASYLAGEATAEYLDAPSLEGAARMEARYQLAERLGFWEGQR
jgi:hypothetical protein